MGDFVQNLPTIFTGLSASVALVCTATLSLQFRHRPVKFCRVIVTDSFNLIQHRYALTVTIRPLTANLGDYIVLVNTTTADDLQLAELR